MYTMNVSIEKSTKLHIFKQILGFFSGTSCHNVLFFIFIFKFEKSLFQITFLKKLTFSLTNCSYLKFILVNEILF